jgi:hypothetical protein
VLGRAARSRLTHRGIRNWLQERQPYPLVIGSDMREDRERLPDPDHVRLCVLRAANTASKPLPTSRVDHEAARDRRVRMGLWRTAFRSSNSLTPIFMLIEFTKAGGWATRSTIPSNDSSRSGTKEVSGTAVPGVGIRSV